MSHGAGTNAEKWDISPNSHPKFKSGPEMVAEQLLLGRKRPKNITFGNDVGPDAVVVYYIYENPHKLEQEEVMNLVTVASSILQYGIFGGFMLAGSKLTNCTENVGRLPFRAYAVVQDLFEDNVKAAKPLDQNIQECYTLLSDILDDKVSVAVTGPAEVTTIYQHGGLLVCTPDKHCERLHSFIELVDNNKLVIVARPGKLKTHNYTFLRLSRTRVPGFYRKIRTLQIDDSQFIVNDPTGILVLECDISHDEIIQTFRSI